MIRRVIGFLMIFAILFPLLLGATGIVVARDIVVQVQTKWETRISRIQDQVNEVETTVNTVTRRFQTLQTIANRIATSANQAAQAVVTTINNFKIHYGGFQWPKAIQNALAFIRIKLPDIPPVNLDVPGLSAVRDFLQNLYNSLASLTQAISDVTLIAQVPGQIGQIVTEAQGFPSDLIQIVGPYGTTLLVVAIGMLVWIASIYLVLVYTWLVRGWAMLMGRPVLD